VPILKPEFACFNTSDLYTDLFLAALGEVVIDDLDNRPFHQLIVNFLLQRKIFFQKFFSFNEAAQVGVVAEANHKRHQLIQVLGC